MRISRIDSSPQRAYCARLRRGMRGIAGTLKGRGREENELAGARVLAVLEMLL